MRDVPESIMLTVYDTVLLYSHFANKKKPTKKDKVMMAHVDKVLVTIVENMRNYKRSDESSEPELING